MAKNKDEELKGISKYRFIFVGFAAVFLIVFGVVMTINRELADTLIYYLTGGSILIFAIVRFVPLMKYLHEKRRLIMNALEIFANILISVGILYMAYTYSAEGTNTEIYDLIYKIILGIVLAARGVIFMIEGTYCDGEKETVKFGVHIVFIFVSGAVLMPGFEITNIRFLLIAIAFLAGSYCGIDTYRSYNRYRRLSVNKVKEKEYNDKVEQEKSKEVPVPQVEEREEVYVN